MLPPVLDAVLFDVGGTLVQLDYAYIAARARAHGAIVSEVALCRGEVASRRAIDAGVRSAGNIAGSDAERRPRYLATLLRAAGVADELAAQLAQELDAAHRETNLWRVVVAGAGPMLADLRARGLRTAIVSNADGRIQSMLEALGLAHHFDLVVDSHYEGVEKPDPEIFRRALERLGVAAGRAAYVGDIYSIDAVGARAAGLAPVILDLTGSYGGIDCTRVAGLGELLDAIAPRGQGGA